MNKEALKKEKSQYSLRIDKNLYEKAVELAGVENRSINNMLCVLIERGFAKEK